MFKNTGIVAIFFLWLCLPAFAGQTTYSAIIEDLPLMPGMVEKTDDAIIFDKPGGRIVETGADITASPAEIERFYRRALPPLGWKAISSSGFIREDEILKLGIEKHGGTVHVRFTLKPKHEGQ